MTIDTLKSTNATIDFDAIKTRQQAAWASGDYAIVGTTLQIVGENLCEAMDLNAGSQVLDVAAGNGNATLAAARRFCNGVSVTWFLLITFQHFLKKAANALLQNASQWNFAQPTRKTYHLPMANSTSQCPCLA